MFHSDDGSCNGSGDSGDMVGENDNIDSGNSLAAQQPGVARIPNTPEILSALISINPMDTFMSQQRGANSPTDDTDSCSVASSNLDSPSSPPNQINLRTQLIKEDLKMRLQERRMRNSEDQPQSQQLQQPLRCKVSHRQHPPLEARYSSSGCDESSMDTEEDEGNLSNGDTNSNGYEVGSHQYIRLCIPTFSYYLRTYIPVQLIRPLVHVEIRLF